MNRLKNRASPIRAEFGNQVIEIIIVAEELAGTSSGRTQDHPIWLHGTLNGYDASMRRHAAACEAGR